MFDCFDLSERLKETLKQTELKKKEEKRVFFQIIYLGYFELSTF